MINRNFQRITPAGPRISIDEAAFSLVEAFVLSLTRL